MSLEKLGFTDTDGQFRGKYICPELLFSSLSTKFCDVVFGWDINDECFKENHLTGWKTGFKDAILTKDENIEAINMPWENGTVLHIADFSQDDKFKHVCPRSLLKNFQNQWIKRDIYPQVGFEYEWYNFKNDENTIQKLEERTLTKRMNGYSLLKLSENYDFFSYLLEQLQAINVPIVGLHTETGPGVIEAAIKHDNMLKATDYAALFKFAIKAASLRKGILATFMARWSDDYPGSGGHMHVSLQNDQNQSLIGFDGSEPNELTSQFLAGLIEGLPVLMPLMAPNINSYKRFSRNSWTPMNYSWSFESRISAIRVKKKRDGGAHLEIRIPGADANPYLVNYAILSAGYYGIANKLKLNQKYSEGLIYDDEGLKKLPKSLYSAVQIMKASKLVKQMIDPVFADFFIMTREHEMEQFNQYVSNWELERYIENV